VSAGRGRVASAAQYVLLGGFAAVASGISSQGLIGFARANMALSGPWPYLLFLALDGAAGVCAVLLARRAARGSSSLAPRIAVWGLVGASAAFNYSHAPHRPDAAEAYAMMPAIAAVLFEFCLQETRSRAGGRAGRRLGALRWLRPAERVRVQLRMAAEEALSADEATRRVRVESAARSLYRLREELAAGDRAGECGPLPRRGRRALRRAHAALATAGFADEAIAAEVLRNVQVLTMTTTLAALDYSSADAAHAAIASLVAPRTAPTFTAQSSAVRPPELGSTEPSGAVQGSEGQGASAVLQHANGFVSAPGLPSGDGVLANGGDHGTSIPGSVDRDGPLVEAARRIAADAARDGGRLSQAELAKRLRGQGLAIGNDRLSWLASAIDLGPQRRGS
jgi:Protein of unknown function (DUF2637)